MELSTLLVAIVAIHTLEYAIAQLKSQKINVLAEDTESEWCPSWKNLICGSDGVTYWNECLFQRAQNRFLQQRKNLEQIQMGVCDEPKCMECRPSENVSLYRICASNNNRLPDKCTLKCYKEDFPLVTEDLYGCENNFPSPEEIDDATSETFMKMLQQLVTRTIANIKNEKHALKIELENFQGILSSQNITFQTIGRKGWMSEVSNFDVREGFSFSAHHPGRLRFELNTEGAVIGYDKILVTSGSLKAMTSLQIKVHDMSLEMITDLSSSESNCARIQPSSLRLLQLNNISMETSKQFPEGFPVAQLQGFIKERFFSNMNKVIKLLKLSPTRFNLSEINPESAITPEDSQKALKNSIIPEMLRIGCLSWPSSRVNHCFGAFQTRFCTYQELFYDSKKTIMPTAVSLETTSEVSANNAM